VSACVRCGVDSGLALCPSCLLQDDAPVIIGGLELVEEIGRGGMGHVWRARDPVLQREVAVKFLEPSPVASETRERLRREARALARLDHPAIVRVLDVGEDDEQAWLVMELAPGQPLSDLVPLPVDRATDVAAQVAEALAYAHARSVVHRDVKPANVLVDGEGRARLLDFGIARRTDAADGITRSGLVAGSPPYMAPEAMAGGAPDPRADVYSLGAMLRELLGEARPAALDAIVRRAMDADPARRPDAAALAGALRDAQRGAHPGLSLPEDERTLLHAVALLQTLATAAALWAIVQSLTPRVLAAHDVGPLVMLDPEALPDGRMVSRARFETWPVLVAVAATVVALVGRALLARHWRQSGLDVPAPPSAPLPEARLVFWMGLAACVLFLVRRVVFGPGALSVYVPLVGGLLELGIVHVAWVTVLEASRTRRSLASLPALWVGLVFALVPPVVDLLRYLATWRA
jgi:hypothetical protein